MTIFPLFVEYIGESKRDVQRNSRHMYIHSNNHNSFAILFPIASNSAADLLDILPIFIENHRVALISYLRTLSLIQPNWARSRLLGQTRVCRVQTLRKTGEIHNLIANFSCG